MKVRMRIEGTPTTDERWRVGQVEHERRGPNGKVSLELEHESAETLFAQIESFVRGSIVPGEYGVPIEFPSTSEQRKRADALEEALTCEKAGSAALRRELDGARQANKELRGWKTRGETARDLAQDLGSAIGGMSMKWPQGLRGRLKALREGWPKG